MRIQPSGIRHVEVWQFIGLHDPSSPRPETRYFDFLEDAEDEDCFEDDDDPADSGGCELTDPGKSS